MHAPRPLCLFFLKQPARPNHQVNHKPYNRHLFIDQEPHRNLESAVNTMQSFSFRRSISFSDLECIFFSAFTCGMTFEVKTITIRKAHLISHVSLQMAPASIALHRTRVWDTHAIIARRPLALSRLSLGEMSSVQLDESAPTFLTSVGLLLYI